MKLMGQTPPNKGLTLTKMIEKWRKYNKDEMKDDFEKSSLR